jgi:hypothetical protein
MPFGSLRRGKTKDGYYIFRNNSLKLASRMCRFSAIFGLWHIAKADFWLV